MDFPDLQRVTLMPLLAAFAWLAPERAWPQAARTLAAITTRLAPRRTRRNARRVPPLLLQRLHRAGSQAAGSRATFSLYEAGTFENLVHLFREYRPGGWRPDIRVEGGEHLETALRRDSGAILWITESSRGAVARLALLASRSAHRERHEPRTRRLTSPADARRYNRRRATQSLSARVLLGVRASRPGG